MPVLCVLVSAFRLGVAALRDPAISSSGQVLVADKFERGRVVECSPAAFALGARAGMTLVQGQAAAREATVVVDDPVEDRVPIPIRTGI